MSDKFCFRIITPEELVFSSNIEMALIPGSAGYFSILAGHAPMISSTKNGAVKVFNNNKIIKSFFVDNGFIKLNEKDVDILVNEACLIDDLNKSELISASEAIKKQLKSSDEISSLKEKQENIMAKLEALNFCKKD